MENIYNSIIEAGHTLTEGLKCWDELDKIEHRTAFFVIVNLRVRDLIIFIVVQSART